MPPDLAPTSFSGSAIFPPDLSRSGEDGKMRDPGKEVRLARKKTFSDNMMYLYSVILDQNAMHFNGKYLHT